MTPKQKKMFLIIIPIVVVVIIAIILAILYFSTDFLKSNKTLFLKYMSQNVDAAKIIIDNTSEKEYADLLKRGKYESTAELTANYTQNINTSQENRNNDINKLKLTIDSQSDYQNDYNYKDIKLAYDNEDLFTTEYIHDGEIYGIRFSDMFSQFLSIENTNLKEVAQKAGLTEEQIELIPDRIEEFDFYDMFSFTDEEIAELQDKYMNVLSANISNDKFEKRRNAMITVNGNSITTNEYSVSLTQEGANNVAIKLLEELKNDNLILNKISQNKFLISAISLTRGTVNTEEISDEIKQNIIETIDELITEIQDNNIGTEQVKCTVYEYKGKTIRTTYGDETQKIIIDLDNSDSGITVNMQNTNENSEQENTSAIKIIKNNSDSEDIFSIQVENTLGEEISTIELYRNKKVVNSNITVKTGMIYDDGEENKLDVEYSENINFVEQVEKFVLDETNNVVLNDYDEERVSTWINQVIERLNQKFQENASIINNIIQGGVLGQAGDGVQIEQTEMPTEVERNRFNSKFEFYAGTDISSDQVLSLIDAAKDSLKGAQVSYSDNGTTSASNKKLQGIRMEIEKGTENENLADSVKDLIEINRKYTVELQYDSNTNVVSFITITVNK